MQFRAASLFAGTAAVLLGIRVWAVSESWRDYDRDFFEFRAAVQAITPGARLLVVETPTSDDETTQGGKAPDAPAVRSEVIYRHMPALAVIDRSAYIPYLFTGPTPVLPSGRNAKISHMVGKPLYPEMLERVAGGSLPEPEPDLYGQTPYWGEWTRDFDFLLWIDIEQHYSTVALDALQERATGRFFRIYRVNKP